MCTNDVKNKQPRRIYKLVAQIFVCCSMWCTVSRHFPGLTWQHSEEGAAEAVAHGVGTQADVHASVLLLGSRDEQLVEVGTVRPGPHLSRGQHHEPCIPHLDGGVVAAFLVRLDAFEPLDDRLHVTPHFTLEWRGASVVHRRVDWVSARQNRFGVCPLCTDTQVEKQSGWTHTDAFWNECPSADRRGLSCPYRF